MNWSKWKSHEYDSVKATLIIVFVVACIVIIATRPSFRNNFLLGLINPDDVVPMSITLTTIPSATTVQPGIYSVGAAKLYDEMAPVEGWLDTTKTLMGELEPNDIRYPTGGLVKYIHAFTAHMSQPLTASELAHVVDVGDGPELRGVGYITQDRLDEEALGNEGELAEITDPKPVYGNLSYIDGFQNLQPRNFIHDYVEIADAADAGTLFVVNMRYASPTEVADQVKFLVDHGQTIAGVEMENESYAKGGFYYIPGNPSINAPIAVTNYLNDADEYRTAINAKVPGLSYAVVAAPKKGVQETENGFDSNTEFNAYWNTALATQMGAHGYTNYIMHFYVPFTSCIDEIAAGNRDTIFACGNQEMHSLRQLTNPTNDPNITVFPAILDSYATQFPGKHMWLTEWNINQDPTKTDSKYANSVLHGILTQNILNMMNDANVRHNNFITYAVYHTFATDGGNAMVNQHVSKGFANSEPEDIDGFVRRTPYYAYMSMKPIFKEGYKPMQATFTLSDGTIDAADVTVHGYKKTDGTIALAISNTSFKTLSISSLSIDGQQVDLSASSADGYFMDGDANYASRGDTEFAVNPGHEVTIRDESYNILTQAFLPSYGVGTVTVHPTYQEAVVDDGTASPDNNMQYASQTLTYATLAGGKNLQMQLIKPVGAQHPLPVVIWVGGGAFTGGGLGSLSGYESDFTGAGYAIAPMTYRAVTDGLFPGQIQDVKGAIRYMRAHAAELNIDPNKIAVGGFSSGGALMSLAGTSSGTATLEGTVGGNAGVSSRPDAVIDISGSLDPANPYNLSDTVETGLKSIFGCTLAQACNQTRDAIAGNYADAGDPAFLILHGTNDQQVMYANSVALKAVFDAAHMDSSLITVDGVAHNSEAILDAHMSDIISFLDAKLYQEEVVPPTADCGFWDNLFGGCNDDDDTPPAPPADTKAPSVVLTSPAANSLATPMVLMSARAKDNTGVVKVDFYAEPLGLLNSDTTYPYTFQWSTAGIAPGNYFVQAKAYDAAGNVASSKSVKVVKQ